MNVQIQSAEIAENMSYFDGTYSIDGETPTSGYVVAFPAFTETYSDDLDYHTVLDIVWKFILKHWGTVQSNSALYFGRWLDKESDEKTVYLDIVMVIKDRDKAIECAQSLHEIAIYDLDNDCEIRV